jgi:hypothetical protein
MALNMRKTKETLTAVYTSVIPNTFTEVLKFPISVYPQSERGN